MALILVLCRRFGETLPVVDNIVRTRSSPLKSSLLSEPQIRVQPFENQARPMRYVDDINYYKKLHATLPHAALAARAKRIRSGEVRAIEELWAEKDKVFLAIDFEWSEKNPATCLEWGYAALRAGHLFKYAIASLNTVGTRMRS